jgi:hypothetical protein
VLFGETIVDLLLADSFVKLFITPAKAPLFSDSFVEIMQLSFLINFLIALPNIDFLTAIFPGESEKLKVPDLRKFLISDIDLGDFPKPLKILADLFVSGDK